MLQNGFLKRKAIAERKGKFGGYERVQYSFVKYIIPKLGRKNYWILHFLNCNLL